MYLGFEKRIVDLTLSPAHSFFAPLKMRLYLKRRAILLPSGHDMTALSANGFAHSEYAILTKNCNKTYIAIPAINLVIREKYVLQIHNFQSFFSKLINFKNWEEDISPSFLACYLYDEIKNNMTISLNVQI